MKYLSILLTLIVFACGKPISQSESSADSLGAESADTTTLTDGIQVTDNPDNDLDLSESQEAEDPIDDAFMIYGGEYTLDSSSEAEDGSSLTLTYKSGSTFTISITKMVADFCSGTIEGEISFDSNNTANFNGGGHPVTVRLVNGTVVVEDPERQLSVNSCEFNGTFLNINDGIN